MAPLIVETKRKKCWLHGTEGVSGTGFQARLPGVWYAPVLGHHVPVLPRGLASPCDPLKVGAAVVCSGGNLEILVEYRGRTD